MKKSLSKNAFSLITKNLNWNTCPRWQQEKKHDFVEIGVERDRCINKQVAYTLMIVLLRKLKLSGRIKLNPSNITLLLQEATQKYWKLTVYWTKCCNLFLPLSLFTATCASFVFLNRSFFSSWTQSSADFLRILNVTSDHSGHKYFHFLVWKWFSPS